MTKVPLNAPDATAISFPDWMQCRGELDSDQAGNADVRLPKISARTSLGAYVLGVTRRCAEVIVTIVRSVRRRHFSVLVRGFLSLSRLNSHHHKMWMCACPCKCPLLRVEKPVDDNSVALRRSPAQRSCGLALDHVRPGVDSHALSIAKDNLAAVMNLLWIYSTIVFA